MVLAGCVDGVTEPEAQRGQNAFAFGGMALKNGPLLVGGSARLVQDLRRHTELAHVVQERTPTQLVSAGAIKRQLFAEHLGEGSNTL